MSMKIKLDFKDPFVVVLLINIAVFLMTTILKLIPDTYPMYYMAKINPLISTGEFWRLITCTFAHWNFMHFVSNAIGIWALSRISLPFYGKLKLFIIYMAGGLVGSTLSYILSNSISAGSSGALYGLFGANLYLLRLNPEAYKRIFSNEIIFIIGFNIIYSFVVPNIDISAHLGGLAGGYFCSAAVGLNRDPIFTNKKLPIQVTLSLLIVIAIIMGTLNYNKSEENYLSAISYKYQLYGRKPALRLTEKAIKKFENSNRLLIIKEQLK